jgi:hypothetical protein
MTAPASTSSASKSAALLGVAVLALALVGTAAARAERLQKAPQTSAEANNDSLGSAVVAPLRDINMVRSEIPDMLKRAVADPYAPPATGCEPLKAEIDQLDAVLGDDYDEPKSEKKDDSALSRPVLGVVASTITDVIPMRGWVRRLTGAERHDRAVRDAIKAGFVRRGYLKGLQRAGTCKSDRVVFVAAKPAPPVVLVAAAPVPPVGVAAAPPPVAAPLAPFSNVIRVASSREVRAPAAPVPVP